MTDIPPRNKFYAARDSRTASLTDSTDYRSASLLLTGERDLLTTYAGRVMARTAANLLSRFARDVDVAFPPVDPDAELPPQKSTLGEQCLRRMAQADPHGHFDAVGDAADREYDCVLALGNPRVSSNSDSTIRIDGAGWRARVVRDGSVASVTGGNDNPIGPAVAACLGGAEVFKTVAGMPPASRSAEFLYDAFNHRLNPDDTAANDPPFPTSLELGTVRMVGVGSVGSAAAYFLRRLPADSTVQLVDHDEVELVNLNRSPLFTAEDALESAMKVDTASQFLADHMDARSFPVDYESFEDADPANPDVVLPLANERNVRSNIQYGRPPLQIHATTSQSDVAVRRTIPLDEPCLLCHFPPSEAPVDTTCAEGPTTAPGGDGGDSGHGPDAAFPFASFLAGCFVVAELAKLPLDSYPFTEPVARVQTLTDLGSHWVPKGGTLRKDACPFCPDDNPGFYKNKIKNTLFAHLTTAD